MKKIGIKLLIVWGFFISIAWPDTYIPYSRLNVGVDYTTTDNPIASLVNSLPGDNNTSYHISSDASGVADLFYVKDNYIRLKHDITDQLFNDLKKDNSFQPGDPNQLIFKVNISNDKQSITWPVLFYRGMRVKTIAETIADRATIPSVSTKAPYYFEISATPNDFSKADVSIVDLSHYFYIPKDDHEVKYTLDASKITTDSSPCAVRLIQGVNSVASPKAPSCVTPKFMIEGSHLMAKDHLSAGIYQVSVRADRTIKQGITETDWQTFYMNVSEDNPSLSQWSNGSVASTNRLGDFPSIYIYSSLDPDKSQTSSWQSDYQIYANDLNQINTDYLTEHPIKTVFVEIISMIYTDNNVEWPVETDDPMIQIRSSAITNNRPTIESWINSLTSLFANYHIGVTLNFTFSNSVKADFIAYNNEQQYFLAQKIVDSVLTFSHLDGIAMDLEGGFNQPAATELYKKITDRLAYEGKWFSFFGFGDIFSPSMFASFGPLGVANISTYDVGQYRAPEAVVNPPFTIPYNTDGGWTTDQATHLYQHYFSHDGSCTSIKNGIYSPISYCNLSTNDSYSENNRRFLDDYHHISTHDAVIYFNGKYQLALPLADTATEWNAIELWNPNLDPKAFGTGRLVTNKSEAACSGLDHDFFSNHQDQLIDPNTESYKRLQNCLFAKKDDELGMALQMFSPCQNPEGSPANPVPYSKCLMVSSLPGSKIIGQPALTRSNIIDYVSNNIQAYQDTNQDHGCGYSIFALETASNAPAGAFSDKKEGTNITVQEPWYIGFNDPKREIDPYYNEENVRDLWIRFVSTLRGL